MPAVYAFKMHIHTIDTHKYAKNAYFTKNFQNFSDFLKNSLQGYEYIYIFFNINIIYIYLLLICSILFLECINEAVKAKNMVHSYLLHSKPLIM